MLPPGRIRSSAQVNRKSFIGQVEGVEIPVLISFNLASVLTIYVPVYTVRSWLCDGAWQGLYLAALRTMLFQLTGGAEVRLVLALMVEGASLGTALSIILVAPSTTVSVIRHLSRPIKAKTAALYLVAIWFVASTLGVAVDGIQRLFSG